jgi:hypothetical protein
MKTYLVIPTECCSSNVVLPMFKKSSQKLTYTPWMYLHGELEKQSCSFGGWDKFKWCGGEPQKDGIFDCVVLIGDDDTQVKVVEATAYIWMAHFGDLTGLVVANDDIKSVEYAHKKWEEKATSI